VAIEYVRDGTKYDARVKTTRCAQCGRKIRDEDGNIIRRMDLHLEEDHDAEDYGLGDDRSDEPLFDTPDEVLGGMSV